MKHLCVLTLALVMVPIILSADSAATALYRTDLSPTFEEPPLQGVSAGGLSNIAIHVRRDDDGNLLNAFVDFRVTYFFGQEETVVALHIHEGVVGESGPVVISSGLSTPMTGRFGNIFLQVIVDDPQGMATVERILAAPRTSTSISTRSQIQREFFAGRSEPSLLPRQSTERPQKSWRPSPRWRRRSTSLQNWFVESH